MRNRNKIIVLFLSFLLIFSNLTFIYAEEDFNEETTPVQNEEIIEVEEVEQEVISQNEEKVENQNIEQDNNEAQTETTNKVEEQPKESQEIATEVVEESTEEPLVEEQKPQIVTQKKSFSTLKNTTNEEESEITTGEELLNIVANLNTNGGAKTVKLKNNIEVLNKQYIKLNQGSLTILGEDNVLTACISLTGSAIMHLGKEAYEKTLQLLSNRTDSSIVNTKDTSELYIHNNVKLSSNTVVGQAGGITAVGKSTINMQGGTITNCHSYAVSGGVYLDENATLNMSDGTIENCSGYQGGAVGLSGGAPFGPAMTGATTFNMTGGLINNCTDLWIGGGAVCAYTTNPIAFIMNGGTIQNCKAGNTRYSYGGGALIYSTNQNTKVDLQSGIITDNEAKYGGGIFIFEGDTTVANGFGLHNNIATHGGDDIYNNGANVTLGSACATAVLKGCNHLITGWYEDAEQRWSYGDCTEGEEHSIAFEHIGELYNGEYGLKAAHDIPVIKPEPVEPETVEPEKIIEPENIPTPIIPITPSTVPTKPEPSIVNHNLVKNNTKTTTYIQETAKESTIPINPTTESISNAIKESDIPLVEPQGSWAIINLILVILNFFIVMGILPIEKKTKNEEYTEDEETDVRGLKRFKIYGALIFIISIITFVRTENMALPVDLTDKWTIVMLIFSIIEIINIFVIKNLSKEN